MFTEIAFLTERLIIDRFSLLNPIGRRTPVIKSLSHEKSGIVA